MICTLRPVFHIPVEPPDMTLSQLAGLVGLSPLNGLDDIGQILVIFLHFPVFHGQEAFVVTVNILMNHCKHGNVDGIAGDPGEGKMQGLVSLKKIAELTHAGINAFFSSGEQPVKRFNIRRFSPLSGQGDNISFHAFPKFSQVIQGYLLESDQQIETFRYSISGNRFYPGPAANTQLDFNKPFMFQNPQSLPQGTAAGLKHLFQFSFRRKLVSGFEATGDDRFLDLIDNILKDAILFGGSEQ